MIPKLSIVVPTRERADTLLHTMRTIVNQDYQACEIIVSDNASKDNTREVVESFSDPRIRYINTGKRVSMSENWEFALGHVKGDFVIYIGDDDGFIPGAIAKAMALIEKLQLNAFIWNPIEYCWPDHIDENLRNWFSLRFEDNTLRMVDGRKMFEKAIKFREGYIRLPCVNKGIIRKKMIDKIRESSTNGVFFNSISPDVFSGIVLSLVIDKYMLTVFPFSVNGASRHSTGTSGYRSEADEKDTPAAKFWSENTRNYDYRLKISPSGFTCFMGEYLLAKQFLPCFNLPEPNNWNHYINLLKRDAKHSFNSDNSDKILQSAAHTVKTIRMRNKIPSQIVPLTSTMRLGIQGSFFNFKTPPGMVNNVYDACQLVAGMLPSTIENDDESPFSTFVRRVTNCFIAEAKTLMKKYLLRCFLKRLTVK